MTVDPTRTTDRHSRREEERFREVFQRLHAGHPGCIEDEWLTLPCRDRLGHALDRPWIWSRRNGPWRRVDVLWVGAAPGNAGGRGRGALGAHGTRIPFGGDVAGANLEVLLGAVGLDRNRTFIAAALNRLPDRGGGEPTLAELRSPAGGYADSIELLRDTIIACGPALVIALGNVAARATAACWLTPTGARSLPSLGALDRAGWRRESTVALDALGAPTDAFPAGWHRAWPGKSLPAVIRVLHPSAQNMSPFAGDHTAFHRRMVETRACLRRTVTQVLGWTPPESRGPLPTEGIYALPEWRDAVRPRLLTMDGLWRKHRL